MTAPLRRTGRARVSPETETVVRSWLDYESMLLDDMRRLHEWHDLLAQDVVYQVPVLVPREFTSNLPDYPDGSYHMYDNWFTLKMRIDRLDGEHAWAEDPPSRLRRVVTGIVVTPGGDEAHVNVRSAFHLHRERLRFTPELWVGERHDVLRKEGDDFRLAQRTVYLNHAVLPGAVLSFLF
ncbi:aromatic-ring-hydroxylating dioxygenase subunit beta [Actinomadura sp. NTSP31]|uniref:aromatic-ring-hydroxylating dioxygenase subunit beta n=1 Tax=Actinomadura sp. NTSP31 TaxID=1735447 RepID=UPI0035BEF911